LRAKVRQLSQWCGRLVWLASNAQSTGPLSHSFITVNAHQKHMRAYALVSLHHVIFRLFWTQISNADKIFLASFQVEIKRKPSSTNVTLQFDFQFFNDSQRHSSTLKLIICARGMWLSLSTTSLILCLDFLVVSLILSNISAKCVIRQHCQGF